MQAANLHRASSDMQNCHHSCNFNLFIDISKTMNVPLSHLPKTAVVVFMNIHCNCSVFNKAALQSNEGVGFVAINSAVCELLVHIAEKVDYVLLLDSRSFPSPSEVKKFVSLRFDFPLPSFELPVTRKRNSKCKFND